MTDVTAQSHPAEQRVQRFMAEYDAQWRIAAPAFENRDSEAGKDRFELWRELMGETTRNHFTSGTAVDLAQSFGRPAEFGPDAEAILRMDSSGDVAYVLTRTTSPLDMYHEYTVRQEGGDWRIASIEQHFGDPAEPFIDREAVDERVSGCAPDAPFTEMPAAQASLDEVRNFTEREVVSPRNGESTQAQISGIGTLVTTSGVLSVLDFGYENDDARPLARTVAPGAYPVDRVTGFGRNAAVRVRFSEQTPVEWHPASLPGSGHVIGVDAGCACIVDYVAYSVMSRRDKAAQFERFVTATRPVAFEVPLGETDRGLAFDSGFGDGSYPVYWGVDDHGELAQLVIDFMVLVDQDDDGALAHL